MLRKYGNPMDCSQGAIEEAVERACTGIVPGAAEEALRQVMQNPELYKTQAERPKPSAPTAPPVQQPTRNDTLAALRKQRKLDGKCPDCDVPGDWINMACVCPKCKARFIGG
jgi:hypothetical protein